MRTDFTLGHRAGRSGLEPRSPDTLHGPFFIPWCSALTLRPHSTLPVWEWPIFTGKSQWSTGMPASPSQAGLRSLEYKEPIAGTAGAGEWAAQPQACCCDNGSFQSRGRDWAQRGILGSGTGQRSQTIPGWWWGPAPRPCWGFVSHWWTNPGDLTELSTRD